MQYNNNNDNNNYNDNNNTHHYGNNSFVFCFFLFNFAISLVSFACSREEY